MNLKYFMFYFYKKFHEIKLLIFNWQIDRSFDKFNNLILYFLFSNLFQSCFKHMQSKHFYAIYFFYV